MAEATAKTVYHDWLNLSQLSQVTADMGTIIAGLVRDRDSRLKLNLAGKNLIVTDGKGTDRIRIGKLERGAEIEWSDDIEWEEGIYWIGGTGYGIEIYDSSGTLRYRVGFDIFPEIMWWTD